MPVKILWSHLFFNFGFFLIILNDAIFNAAAWMQIWRIWNFPKKIISSICWKFQRWLHWKTKLYLIHTCKSKVEVWAICAQLYLEVMSKRPKKKTQFSFVNLGVKEFIVKNTAKKNTLIFECYNLVNPMEWWAMIFWSWCTIR